MRLLNLDQLIEDDRIVVLNGKEYKLPSEIPLRMMLKFFKYSQKMNEDNTKVEYAEDAIKTLHDIFSIKNKIDYEVFANSLTLSMYYELMGFLSNVSDDDIKKAQEEQRKKAQGLDTSTRE